MQDSVHTIVIGAGVVGLAIARTLAATGREVIVLERNAQIGEETSSRNSEVIHAGLYYPTASLKARFCVAGRRRLYAYCEQKAIAHQRCGKVIIAVQDAQVPALEALAEQALANGVSDIERLDAVALGQLEPAVRGSSAMLSPSTGILDSHGLLLALQGDIEEAAGHVACHSEMLRGSVDATGFALEIASEGEIVRLHARELVNAAGLSASTVASRLAGLDAEHVPATRFAKGNYFALSGATPFRHLVYPLPEPGGLGIHATLDLAGRARFGPDVEWLDTLDYSVDAKRAESFYAAIRSYWPQLPDGALSPAYAGIRPKLAGPGEPAGDFRIDGPRRHGVVGLVNLFGIESPGLTAALAIADHVTEELDSG
jgi:L-2-hydroxyglutarate oxidase LhgO